MKLALRQLLRTPAFTLVALFTLALGIGVSTSAFTVLNHLIFGSSPYPEPGRIVQVWSTTPQYQNGNVAPGDFCDFREQNTTFAHLSVYYVNFQKSLAIPGHTPERSTAMAVTADFFPVLGIALRTRPVFHAGGSGSASARRHHFSHALLAKTTRRGSSMCSAVALRFDGKTVTIIGVMPPILDDVRLWNAQLDLWHLDPFEANRQVRDKAWYSLIGRLKPGITLAQANDEMKVIAARLAKDYPKTNDRGAASALSGSLPTTWATSAAPSPG